MGTNTQENQENKGLIAISKTLARAKDGMSMQEKKLMAIYLSKIEWKNATNNLEIWVDKKEIMELLGSKMDSTDHSAYLRKLARETVRHSELHFDGKDKDEWEDMPLFTRRKSSKNKLMMELYHGAANLVQGLECEYITLFLRDILRFDSNVDGLRAYTLYEHLRLNSDSRRINTRIISTKEFKEMFHIPKDGKGSYMQYDAKKGKDVFNRTNFEKYVIEPVLRMLAPCEHVVLHNYGRKENGDLVYYNKIKNHGLVQGYELTYTINKYPRTIRSETIVDIQEKPGLLKVTQNIMDGKKNQKKKPQNGFNNFKGRGYSDEKLKDLEAQLLDSNNVEQ